MSDKVKVRASATVIMTVEIAADGAWGTDCLLEQVHSQAAKSAIGKIRRAVGQLGWRLIGDPKVKSVITEET